MNYLLEYYLFLNFEAMNTISSDGSFDKYLFEQYYFLNNIDWQQYYAETSNFELFQEYLSVANIDFCLIHKKTKIILICKLVK